MSINGNITILVSRCIGCSKLLHKRDNLNERTVSFATKGMLVVKTLRMHLSVITQNSVKAVWDIFLNYCCRLLGRPGAVLGYDNTIAFDHTKLYFRATS